MAQSTCCRCPLTRNRDLPVLPHIIAQALPLAYFIFSVQVQKTLEQSTLALAFHEETGETSVFVLVCAEEL